MSKVLESFLIFKACRKALWSSGIHCLSGRKATINSLSRPITWAVLMKVFVTTYAKHFMNPNVLVFITSFCSLLFYPNLKIAESEDCSDHRTAEMSVNNVYFDLPKGYLLYLVHSTYLMLSGTLSGIRTTLRSQNHLDTCLHWKKRSTKAGSWVKPCRV